MSPIYEFTERIIFFFVFTIARRSQDSEGRHRSVRWFVCIVLYYMEIRGRSLRPSPRADRGRSPWTDAEPSIIFLWTHTRTRNTYIYILLFILYSIHCNIPRVCVLVMWLKKILTRARASAHTRTHTYINGDTKEARARRNNNIRIWWACCAAFLLFPIFIFRLRNFRSSSPPHSLARRPNWRTNNVIVYGDRQQ